MSQSPINARISELAKEYINDNTLKTGAIVSVTAGVVSFGLLFAGPIGVISFVAIQAISVPFFALINKDTKLERTIFLMNECLTQNPIVDDKSIKSYVDSKWGNFQKKNDVACYPCNRD